MIKNCLLIFALVALFSCRTQRYVYSPSAPAIPYFQQKGDSKFSAFYSAGDNGVNTINLQTVFPEKQKNEGFDIQAAYAITNHWAVMFNYFNRREVDLYDKSGNIFDTSVVNYNRNLAEFGIGYFIPLNKSKTITYNIYCGMGLGKFSINEHGLDNTSTPYSRFNDNNITKTFLQGGFNFILSEYFRFSVGGRFSFVHYSKNNSSYTTAEQQYFFLDKIENRTINFYEPTFSTQIGIPQINWAKLEGSFTLSSSPSGGYPAARGANYSIGLTFDVAKLFKNKK